MSTRQEFLDLVCQYRDVWIPFFAINAILLLLAVVSVVLSEPGSAEYVLSVATSVMLVIPFVTSLYFISYCADE